MRRQIVDGLATQGFGRQGVRLQLEQRLVSDALARAEVKAQEQQNVDIQRCMVRDNATGELQCALCFEGISTENHIKRQFQKTNKISSTGCLISYLKGETVHTDEERARGAVEMHA